MEPIYIFTSEEEGCSQETIRLKPFRLFTKMLSLYLPEELEPMREEEKDMYYPYEGRPLVILTGCTGHLQMTFQLLHTSLNREEILDGARSLYRLMEEEMPGKVFGNLLLYQEGKMPIAWFTIDLDREEKGRKHVKYVTSLLGRFFLGTVTYPKEESFKWQAALKNIFGTFEEGEETEWKT